MGWTGWLAVVGWLWFWLRRWRCWLIYLPYPFSYTNRYVCQLSREGGEYHWCIYAEWMNRRKKNIKHVENSFIIQLFTYNIGFGNGNGENWELRPTAAKEATVKSEKMMEKGIIIIYTTNTIANSQGYMFNHHLQLQLQLRFQKQHKPMIQHTTIFSTYNTLNPLYTPSCPMCHRPSDQTNADHSSFQLQTKRNDQTKPANQTTDQPTCQQIITRRPEKSIIIENIATEITFSHVTFPICSFLFSILFFIFPFFSYIFISGNSVTTWKVSLRLVYPPADGLHLNMVRWIDKYLVGWI